MAPYFSKHLIGNAFRFIFLLKTRQRFALHPRNHLSPREQREHSKLMVTDTRRSEAVLNFSQDCNAVRLRESQIIRHHHNRIHIGLLTKNSLLGLYVAQRILLLIPFEVCRRYSVPHHLWGAARFTAWFCLSNRFFSNILCSGCLMQCTNSSVMGNGTPV